MKVVEQQKEKIVKSLTELADAHCHLELIQDTRLIKRAVECGVLTMITNGVDTSSNIKALELADNKNIFAALGMDPEHIIAIPEAEVDRTIEFNIGLIRQNRNRIVGIGEIGLDYKESAWKKMAERQKRVFQALISLASELNLPISVHSRETISEVLEILEDEGAKKVHLHYFEGSVEDAEIAVKRGYMISVPPIESSKRRRILAATPLKNLMAESDAPVVGKSPLDIERSVMFVAAAKGMEFRDAAAALTNNTKEFFGIGRMKSGGLIRI